MFQKDYIKIIIYFVFVYFVFWVFQVWRKYSKFTPPAVKVQLLSFVEFDCSVYSLTLQ